MRLLRYAATLILVLVLLPARARGQDLPLFDAHLHCNQSDWAAYCPETARAILDQAGVCLAMVSSTPDEAGHLSMFGEEAK